MSFAVNENVGESEGEPTYLYMNESDPLGCARDTGKWMIAR